MQKLIRDWRQEADFVIVGEIVGIREKINEQINVRDDPAMSYLILDVQVSRVERARKVVDISLEPGSKIPVFFGWFSPEGGDQYPSTLRQDYRRGNVVRMYMNYDDYRFGFYSPGAYYTIEPLK